MKKVVKLIVLLILVLLPCMGFAACVFGSGNNNDNGKPNDINTNPAYLIAPVLERTDFSVSQGIGLDNTFIAYLSCAKDPSNLSNNIYEFEIFIDGEKIEGGQSVDLHDLEYDKIHTIEVTAIGHLNSNNMKLRSATVTVKINITKVESPTNVRMTLSDGATEGKIVWNGEQDVYFDVLYSGVDFTTVNGATAPTWFDTGKNTIIRDYGSGHNTSTIKSIYKSKTVLENFDYFNELSISLYPKQWANFESIGVDGDIFELQMPSDFSTTSVKVLGSEMSQPANLEWDLTVPGKFTFEPVYGMDYSYRTNTYNGSSVTGYGVNNRGEGAGVGYINLESYAVSGTFTFGVESYYSKIDFMSPNIYQIYYSKFDLSSENCEKLTYEIVNTKLDTPKNIRIEGNKLVWDAVPNVTESDHISYWITIGSEEYALSETTANGIHELAIADIAKNLRPFNENIAPFDAEITISAWPKAPELQTSTDGIPIFQTYNYSDKSEPQNAPVIRINSIPAPSGITVDFETRTISWDTVSEADSYTVMFIRNDGSGNGRNGIETNTFSWYNGEHPDRAVLDYITVEAEFTTKITINGQNIELTVGSIATFYVV